LAFEGLKEKLKDFWADLSSKIQENPTFNNLRERFESQTPTVQRAIIYGGAALVVLMLLSFPWSYISESQDLLSQFEDNRGLIQGLLRASRSVKEPPPLPPPMPADMLRVRIDGIIRENRLNPDQIGEIANLPDKPSKDLAPAVVVQTGLAVQLKRLNLDQIMAISHAFQTMGPGTKLMGLDVNQSAGQTHYYDMIARVVNFALPEVKIEETPEGAKSKKGAGKKAAPKDEEGVE
jgi:hypothetical protein